ncbi:hypothetical protein MTR67_053122 [Solanum verrucosum]|uniref:RING-type E3 ubiquitin transferase n=1 Tax=Solanum verrucosum TaxID=315347 RepID=A0AAF0V7G1_SOLVR|nr:hypothetical protein MTR67_053122 [Solanum verrucosum]
MSDDQQGLPTILRHDETIFQRHLYSVNIYNTTIQVDDDEENYNDFSDDDDDDDYEDEDVFEYLKTRTYHVPTMDISGVDDVIVEEQEACAICLIEYNDEDTIGTLQCGHEFHVECIKKWLMRKKTCPFCRAQLLPTHEKPSSP